MGQFEHSLVSKKRLEGPGCGKSGPSLKAFPSKTEIGTDWGCNFVVEATAPNVGSDLH